MIFVSGFGVIDDSIVQVRSPGQSYTCSEKRAKLNVNNDATTKIVFVRLDGGFFDEGDSCDFSVSQMIEKPIGFLLELKGRHMDVAIEQLKNTLKKLKDKGVGIQYRQAVIVSSGAHKIPTSGWQRHQKSFYAQTHTCLSRFASNTKIDFRKAVA